MTNNVHVTEDIPAYALGCLDEEAAGAVAQHLLNCPACRSELESYRLVAARLSLAGPLAAPPAGLRDSLLRRIAPVDAGLLPPSPASGWQMLANLFRRPVPAWSAAGLLLLAALLAGSLLIRQPQLQPFPAQTGNMPTVALVSTEAAPAAHGLIVVGTDGVHGAVVVEDLPVLDSGRQYQLWLIKDGERISGAVFSVDSNGYGAVTITAPDALITYASFGVSIEPAGGSPAPTGDKVLGGSF